METQFYITLTLKTVKGLESFGKFYIGNDRERAFEIFHKLKGSTDVTDNNLLYIDFMETIEELPLNLKVISCTLNQLADNCRTITKELFKLENLEN